LDLVTACLLEEELGKTFLPMELGDVPPLLYACQGDQVDKFLNPALAGKRHPLLAAREPEAFKPDEWKTTATPEGQTFVLQGRKLLSVMPSAQDFLIVLAKAPAGTSAFMLEPNQNGVRIFKNGNITLQLDQCRVDEKLLLGDCGQALHLGMESAPGGCIRLGARYVGLSDRLLEMAVLYAKSWTSLGALLKERPPVQRMLAEVKVQIESVRWLVYHAAWMTDKQGPSRALAAEIRLAVGDLLSKATNLITVVYGGPGPSPQVELHRYVESTIPTEVLEYGLDGARLVIAAELMAAGDGG
jgi:acyl-CoA dehydrogenase